MKEIKSIGKLKEQSTWRLFALGVITLGVYFAFYIKRQTAKINDMVDEHKQISTAFVNAIIAMSFISLFLLFASMPFLMVTPQSEIHPVVAISDLSNFICGIMLLVWAIIARNTLNSAYEISKTDDEWFHGLWTVLFTTMYFNYHVNRIGEQHAEKTATAGS
ncbi:DUF4234 domain-containing protein [Aliidiomarina soli]|uniref:DUF4234 domain-containing protein n=1 Tax=Aliidiomarina soli TaxID=1928574 RepID=A0A432WMG2_9GAMM|nr:DUF4234 domain-containing protein [Aliidiomarina soli]RUO34879.1 hypothetical protein CWE14_02455 [Aliidiomarina soli]